MKQQDVHSRKNIRIQDILPKAREKERGKTLPREPSDSVEYGTDSKVQSHSQSYLGEIEEMRSIMQSCTSCRDKFSQFATKKPGKHSSRDEKSTQTTNKPFLINLIEERVTELCRQNRKLSKMVVEKETEVMERQNEIAEIEQKFTSILYTLGQDLSCLKYSGKGMEEVVGSVPSDPETPSYLKALMLEGQR